MLILSKLLCEAREYKEFTERFSAALYKENITPVFIENTKDIWVRDFMPVKTKSGKFISFRYEPPYLKNDKELRTNYDDIDIPITAFHSDINLDGGNVVFSPSKGKVIISDRIFSGNPEYEKAKLIKKLENLLEAKIFLIPSLKSDLTGHADGMVRFVDENTVVCNKTPYKKGFEQMVKKQLEAQGLKVIDFPFSVSKGISAEGCYLNFYETENTIFLPTFNNEKDAEAIKAAKEIFGKKIIPVQSNEIAVLGGCLNCITWEM